MLLAPPRVAEAYAPAYTITVVSGSAVSFTSANNTTSSLAASAPASVSVLYSTSAAGAGQMSILAPANFTGSGGAAFSIGWLSATCSVAAAGYTGYTVTLVAGGTSSPCVRVAAGLHNANATVTVTFKLDATQPAADSFSAVGFSFVGSAS